MVKEFGEGIRPSIGAIYEHATQLHAVTDKVFRAISPEQKLSRYKAGLATRTEKIRQKIEAKDFKRLQRQQLQLDREATTMKADYQRLKDRFDAGVEKDRISNLPMPKKAIDALVKIERNMKLTGITTLGKLGAAGLTRLVTTPIEEAVGGILSKLPILRRVAAAAPREGGF